jgi:bifunctional DNA primase/polymerase-like protein
MVEALEAALRYAGAGMSVVPVHADGTKAAAVAWKDHTRRRAGEDEIRRWFAEDKPLGVAIVCGAVSGNLLVIDFDQPGYFEEWAQIVASEEQDLLGRLPVVQTPRGYGRHVYMRVPKAVPGAKLAKAPAGNGKAPWVVAIESRGEAQYVLAPGSPPACHPTGGVYSLVSGPFIEEVPQVSEEEAALALRAAKALNRYVDQRAVSGESARTGEQMSRPGDDYCKRGDWGALLGQHGWEKVREKGLESFWRRPGKDDKGISATLGHCRTEQSGALFYVFSSNAAPFECDRAYNLFAAFTLLEHHGDFHAAAMRLVQEGYGQPAPEEMLRKVQAAVEVIRARITASADGAAILPRRRIEAPMKSDPKFKRTWNRSRQDLRLEQNRYDTSLLWYARKLNFTLEEMISLVYDHRLEHQCQPEQALDPSYMAKKIAWVFEAGDSEEATLAVSEAQQVIAGGDDNIVREIRSRTAIPNFVRVIQRGVEEEMYCLELDDGKVVEIGSVQVFREQQKKFISQLYKLLGVNMEEMKGYEWKALHDLFLKTRVVERSEDEEIEVAINEVVERYLNVTTVHIPDGDELRRHEATRRREPYVEGGMLFMNVAHFWQWVLIDAPREKSRGLNRMRSNLKDLGFRPVRIGGPYPRVYHVRAVDDFPSKQLLEKIARASPPQKSSSTEDGESTYA